MTTERTDPDQLLTPDQVAEILCLPVAVVRRKLRRGEIPGIRIGRLHRIHRTELRAWLAVQPRSNT